MEMLRGGDILDRLKQMRRPFTACETRNHVAGIFQAISYLHYKNIAHRDLKPENMLFESFEENAPLKLIDFGFSKSLRKHGALSSPCGTIGYSCKELVVDACQKKKVYTTAVDMFSMGCVAFCMLFADPPFLSDNSDDQERAAEIDRKVELGIYEFPENIPLSPEGKDFLEKLLATNPEDRMTAFEALNHPWMTGDTLDPPDPETPLTSLVLVASRSSRASSSKVGRTSLTEERSSLWIRQNTQRPIETFKRREMEREKEREKIGIKLEIKGCENEKISMKWDIGKEISDKDNRKEREKETERDKKNREKDLLIRQLFL